MLVQASAAHSGPTNRRDVTTAFSQSVPSHQSSAHRVSWSTEPPVIVEQRTKALQHVAIQGHVSNQQGYVSSHQGHVLSHQGHVLTQQGHVSCEAASLVGGRFQAPSTSITSMLVTQADPKPKLSFVMEQAAQRSVSTSSIASSILTQESKFNAAVKKESVDGVRSKPIPPPLPMHLVTSSSDVSRSPSVQSPRKSLFKRSRDDGMEKVLEEVDFERRFEQLPIIDPQKAEAGTPLPKSPRDIISSYRKKKRLSIDTRHTESSDTDGIASPHVRSARFELGTPVTTPKTRKDDRHFFGSSFSLEALAEVASLQRSTLSDFEDKHSPLTPKTPNSPGAFSSLRKILDQRRQLVVQLFEEHGLFPTAQATSQFISRYSDIFPSKSILQLKIREVRQKMMAEAQLENAPSTPTLTSGGASTNQREAGVPRALSAISHATSLRDISPLAQVSTASVTTQQVRGITMTSQQTRVATTSTQQVRGIAAQPPSRSLPTTSTASQSRIFPVTSQSSAPAPAQSAIQQRAPASAPREGAVTTRRSHLQRSVRYSDSGFDGTAQQFS